jgi:hypothetical protein
MVNVAPSLNTTSNFPAIRKPTTVSGTVFFSDYKSSISSWVIRSYKPGTLVDDIALEPLSLPWELTVETAEWPSRIFQACVLISDGSIVMMGGYMEEVTNYNDVWRSTNNGVTWTQQTASAGWTARLSHTSVAMTDGSIVLMGGKTSFPPAALAVVNDVWRSTDNGATWTQQTASAGWTARYGHTSVVLPDGSIVLMGGYSSTGGYKNDVWRSTDNGATWTQQTASAGWTARYRHTSVVLTDGSIVLMGGGTPTLKNDVWRSTDKGATWTQLTGGAEWSVRDDAVGVVLSDGSIVLLGGFDGSSKDDVWRSVNNGTTWTIVNTSAGWKWCFGSVVVDSCIIVIGGTNLNDVWTGRLDRSPLLGMYSVFGGSQLFVAYQDSGYTYGTTMRLYNPQTIAWENVKSNTFDTTVPVCSLNSNTVYVYGVVGAGKGVNTYSENTSSWAGTEYTTSGVEVLPSDMILAKRSGTIGKLFTYNYKLDGTVAQIREISLPTPTGASGSPGFIINTPDATISSHLGNKHVLPTARNASYAIGSPSYILPNTGGLLSTLPGAGGNDDVFARFRDDIYTDGSIVIMRWRSGIGWEEVSGFANSPMTEAWTSNWIDNGVMLFENVGGTLFFGYDYTSSDPDIGKMVVYRFVSSNVHTSSWVDTQFPSLTSGGGGNSGFLNIIGIATTTGASSAIYASIRNANISSSTTSLVEMQFRVPGLISSTIVLNPLSGDVYNVGGISSEPTTHIVFTLWDNAAYCA